MFIKNLLLGTAIGDAFGAGVEFQDRHWINTNVDFSTFVNARSTIPVDELHKAVFTTHYRPWDYTDDTEMTIGLIKALLSENTFSEQLLIQKWREEYQLGEKEKGYGRNGHGSMRWYYNGEQTIENIRAFQQDRPNPGNAPLMRVSPVGLLPEKYINTYAAINAKATHPHPIAISASQCIARAATFLVIEKGDQADLLRYILKYVDLNRDFKTYLNKIEQLAPYDNLRSDDFETLLGSQPIQTPYFLPGIHGLPSDAKYTTGAVLYVLKNSTDAFDALKKAVLLGGDVDSVAAITTGIMAARNSLDSIPDFMINRVEGWKYLNQLGDAFELFINKMRNTSID